MLRDIACALLPAEVTLKIFETVADSVSEPWDILAENAPVGNADRLAVKGWEDSEVEILL